VPIRQGCVVSLFSPPAAQCATLLNSGVRALKATGNIHISRQAYPITIVLLVFLGPGDAVERCGSAVLLLAGSYKKVPYVTPRLAH